MKFTLFIVVTLAAIFYVVTGRVVEEGTARAARGVGSKGLLLQQLCKNESAVENNVIICLVCRGFSRLCFTMTNVSSAPGSSPSTNKPSSSGGGSTSTTIASDSPSDGGGE